MNNCRDNFKIYRLLYVSSLLQPDKKLLRKRQQFTTFVMNETKINSQVSI